MRRGHRPHPNNLWILYGIFAYLALTAQWQARNIYIYIYIYIYIILYIYIYIYLICICIYIYTLVA